MVGLASWHLARSARGEPPKRRNEIPLKGANPPEPRIPDTSSYANCKVLGRVPIIVFGGYGPRPASITDQFFAVLISRPSSCVRPESVQICFDGF